MAELKPSTVRMASIDIFRALIMLLMIFVNDLWSLSNIPAWLEHTAADTDGMGLADVVFPAFLFIVGLSIPFAIRNRIRKGDNTLQITLHILIRALALIIMGFFHVNMENINPEMILLSRPIFGILMTISFFLIWNIYPESGDTEKKRAWWFRGSGIVLLIFLAIIFRGGDAVNPVWMRPYWWGILGLIGWSYLVSALIYLFFRQKFFWIILALLFFCFLNYMEFSPVLDQIPRLRLIISASNYTLVMCGVLASVIYQKFSFKKGRHWILFLLLLFLAAVFIGYGFEVRPLGGISKIKATPSWTAICAGISFALFAFLYMIADRYRFTRWADIIAPAGRSTLTCYLIPYIIYPLMTLVGWQWPLIISSGYPGLLKSFVFALLIVWITGLLEKIPIKLRI